MKRFLCTALALSLLVLCAGCGGSGGGSGSSGNGSTLSVTSVIPEDTSDDVTLDSSVTITFSRSIEASSLSVTLTGNGDSVDGETTVSGNTAVFDPTGELSPNTEYTVTIGRGVENSSSIALRDDYSWTFTTGSIESVEHYSANACVPQVAMNDDGFAVAVWEQTDGLTNSIYANQYFPGSGWSQAQLIETLTGDAHDPQVAVDESGNAVVVWQQHDGTAYSIYTNRYMPGSGWGAAALIESGTGNAYSPQVAVDMNGNAVAVWSQYVSSYYSIYGCRYVIGTGWGTAALIESANGYASDPQVAMDMNGNAVAVWKQYDGTANSIYTNRFVLGTGWSAAGTLLEATNYAAGRPQIAIDDGGNAMAVWEQSDGTVDRIYANRYVNGVGWAGAQSIETGTLAAHTPQVAMDSNGNAIAVWAQIDSTVYSIYANRYVVGVGWGTGELLEEETGQASSPQVAMYPDGNAIAVWSQLEATGTESVFGNQYNTATGWDTGQAYESSSTQCSEPQVALGAYSDGLVTWKQEDSTNPGIFSIMARILD